MSVIQPGRERATRYEAVQAGPDFSEARRRFHRFTVPLVVAVLGWYFLYVALAAFAPGLMAVPVVGEVNVGLCLGLFQFVSTFAVTTIYVRWARSTLDPMIDRLRERLEQDGVR
ncbi:MAG TPA: DUF485 domain-containing protein [Kineosporiaceae bacterium]|nr:DUF485 domain-containing protein [Kineosporiaceae bacterium]